MYTRVNIISILYFMETHKDYLKLLYYNLYKYINIKSRILES